jgi:chitosanase
MLMVIEDYTKTKPDNALAQFLAPLRAIDKEFAASNWEDPVGSTKGLDGPKGGPEDGLEEVWAKTAKTDKAFRTSQDNVFNELYLQPALERAKSVKTAGGKGIDSAVGQMIILDTIIQHGPGTDADGLPTIMSETANATGKNPTEELYLKTFLDIREKHLKHAADEDTRGEWLESVPRVHALRQILKSGNDDLRGRLVFDVYEGDHWDIKAVS